MKRQDSLIRDTSEGGPSIKVYTSAMRAVQKEPGSLIAEVGTACKRLASTGWRDLMLLHGIDIAAKDLAHELTKPLENIDRSVPGFEDFAWEGTRGIEPGRPALSLLFHAFASPHVIGGKKGSERTACAERVPCPRRDRGSRKLCLRCNPTID